MRDGERPELPGRGLGNKLLASGAFAALLYLGFLIWADRSALQAALARFPWLLVGPILALSFANYAVRYLKFDLYLKLLGVDVPRGRGFRIFLAGLAGTVTPGKLGEVLKSWFLLRDHGAPVCRTAPIVLAERFTDLLGLLILCLAGLGNDRLPLAVASVPLVGLLVLAAWPGLVDRLLRPLRARGGRWATWADRLAEAYDSTRVLLAGRNLPVATVLSVLSWGCECAGFILVLGGLGISVAPERAVFAYCFATLVGALAMLPGGLGATEGSLTALLVAAGATSGAAVAATLLIRACTLWFAVLVGVLALTSLRDPARREG